MRQTVESFPIAGRWWQTGQPASRGEAPMEIDAVYGDKGEGWKGNYFQGQKGKEKREDSTTKASTRSARSSKALVVPAGKGDTSNETAAPRTQLLKWVRRPLLNHRTAATTRAAAQTDFRLYLVVLSAETTAGTISTLVGERAYSGWLCALVTDANDMRMRENELVELLVDTRATEHVWGPHDFGRVELASGPEPALKTAHGDVETSRTTHCGLRVPSRSAEFHGR